MDELELANVITALRGQLQVAMSQGEDQDLRFQATGLDVEFQVGVTKSVGAKGGVKFWVLELGGEASRDTQATQTVKLSLKPITREGGDVAIASSSDVSPLTGSG